MFIYPEIGIFKNPEYAHCAWNVDVENHGKRFDYLKI